MVYAPSPAPRVAVITGAASGIGLALARRAAADGMALVLADIAADRLSAARAELDLPDDRVLARVVDVSQDDEVAALAEAAYARFGAVHLLCNNAGVGLTRVCWEYSRADWEWVLGVNLGSVISGVRHFVPRMRAQADASHIVNTASAAGLVSTPGMAAYNVSKHGVVTLSETLYAELRADGGQVGVSVLCPAWVPTAIHDSGRNRPPRFGDAAPAGAQSAAYQKEKEGVFTARRLTADDMARAVFDAVAEQRFYVIPHRKLNGAITQRFEAILAQRNPVLQAPK